MEEYRADQSIGPYKLLRKLGEGGFGEVWEVEDGRSRQRFAAKILEPADESQADEFFNLILREVISWSAAGGHPNIHTLRNAEKWGSSILLLSDIATDGSLRSWLKQRGGRAPSPETAVAILSGVLNGLESLHGRKPPLLHLDLKPENVLLFNGVPRLADFGISLFADSGSHIRLTKTRGTQGYMGPEVYRGEYRIESDLWSAGVMLYELLSGRMPFPGALPEQVMYGVLNRPPAPLDSSLPAPLAAAVMKALEKDWQQRFQSAAAMRAALQAAIGPPDTRINPVDGAEMVWIPGGKWQLGDSDQSDNPVHPVTLSGYWMYRYPVTVAQFRRFTEDRVRNGGFTYDWNGRKPRWGWIDDHPMVCVSWEDASAYCQWAGISLPSESQWEHAARGPEGWKYPWGNELDVSKLQCSKKEVGDAKSTAKVGSYPANAYGLYDMAGNVWEWCADWYDAAFWKNSASFSNIDPVNRNSNSMRVVRGGSWFSGDPVFFRASYRGFNGPADRNFSDGFRGCSQD